MRRFTIAIVLAAISVSDLVMDRADAEDERAARCLEKVRQFVEEIEYLFQSGQRSVRIFWPAKQRLIPAEWCFSDEVISLVKGSKYFVAAHDMGLWYTIVLESNHFIVSFELRKGTGIIEVPAAQTRW